MLSAVQPILDELVKDKNNRLYVEGLAAIDQLSEDDLSQYGTGSRFDHSTGAVVSECQKLLSVYVDVPIINETLEALVQPIRGNGPRRNNRAFFNFGLMDLAPRPAGKRLIKIDSMIMRHSETSGRE